MINVTIDGPKGSGKSTLAKKLAKRLNNHHFYFGPEKSYTKPEVNEEYIKMKDSKEGYILERGPLSDFIFLATRPWFPEIEIGVKKDENGINTPDLKINWLPINIEMLSNYFKNATLNIILYTSDETTLTYNLNNRKKEIGKYANTEELKYLTLENKFYKFLAETARDFADLDNVLILDISNYSYDTIDRIVMERFRFFERLKMI